jgi:peptide/nickel transport system substrate-binding protein
MGGWRLAFGLAAVALAWVTAPLGAQPKKDTLSVDLPADAATLDPHVQWDTDSYSIYRNIFDNLLTRDADGKIVPQIAAAWRYVSDTVIDFDIRTDVKFHDGTPLTAEDVVYSVKRITNPQFKSPQLGQFNSIVAADIVPPATVRLTTKEPYPALLAQLVKLSIVPKRYVESVGDAKFNLEPMGSGPYRLSGWQKGVRVALAANDAYWRGAPFFKQVTFQPVPDASTRIADLRTGKADIARGLNADDTAVLKGEAQLQILSVPTERIGYLFVNALWGPTKDVRVRRAIAHAIDRGLIIEALLGGYGRPVDIMLTPANFGYMADIKGYDFDLAKAKALIKEAGAEGAELPFMTSPVYDQRIAQAVQQMLGEAGLKVTIAMSDQATYLRRRQGTPQDAGSLSIGRWSCACQDADGVIQPLFHSASGWSKFKNAAYDEAVEKARATLDQAERLAWYRKALDILKDEVPGIGLYQDVAIYGARKGLRWKPAADESFFVFNMGWD